MRKFVAAGFGVGLLPRRWWGRDDGAGSLGAAIAALIGLALWPVSWGWGLTVAVVAVATSLWAAAPFAAGGEDPGWVAIDEVAGTLVALVGLSGFPWLVALAVARAVDIFKILPGVRRAEGLPGALGVTGDDVIAGLYGLAAGWIVASLVS